MQSKCPDDRRSKTTTKSWIAWRRATEPPFRGGWEILDVWLDVEEIYFEFVCNWDAVRYKIGETPLGNALEKAEAHPLRPRRSTRYPEFLARYSRFVSVAGWLRHCRPYERGYCGGRRCLVPLQMGHLLRFRNT